MELFDKVNKTTIKLSIFLFFAVLIFFNSYYAGHIAGEGVDRYCSKYSNSSNFLLSEDYRNCLLDKRYRSNLIDSQIENKIKELNVARSEGLSKFEDLKTELMTKVDYIGVEKFIEINWAIPDSLNFTYKPRLLPPLVKATFNDCRYISYGNNFWCDEQILIPSGKRVSGHWIFEASQLPNMKFIQATEKLGAVNFYLDIPTIQRLLETLSFDFTVVGFEITKEHINKNIDGSIQSTKNRLNKFR